MDAKLSKGDQDICDAIECNILYYKDIAVKLDRSNGTILRSLSIMKKTGDVIPIGRGKYQLSAKHKKDVIDPKPDVDSNEPLTTELPSKSIVEVDSNEPLTTESALRLLAKTRKSVEKLMDDYNKNMAPFPKNEIYALTILEKAYKEINTETAITSVNTEVIILPHNKRQDLTQIQYENYLKYEFRRDSEESEEDEKNDDQLCFWD